MLQDGGPIGVIQRTPSEKLAQSLGHIATQCAQPAVCLHFEVFGEGRIFRAYNRFWKRVSYSCH